MISNVTTSTMPTYVGNLNKTSPVITSTESSVEAPLVEAPTEDNPFSDKMIEKIEQAIAKSEEEKEKKWQMELNMAYIESKQAVINAYTMSAKGEALYDNENGFSANNLMNIDSNLAVEAPTENLTVPKQGDYIGGDVISIQSEKVMNTTAINSYNNVQREREGQLFSLTA